MKVVLNREMCNCWDPTCEAHFGWHFLRGEMTPVDCVIEMVEDGRKEITFFIKDRDGSDRTLVVTDENRAQVHDSWLLALEEQEAGRQA